MKSDQKKTESLSLWWWLVGLGLLVGLFWLTINRKLLLPQHPVVMEEVGENPDTSQTELIIGETPLMAEVRRTSEEQSLGLSWRETMAENEGMVFVYQQPYQGMFWMKGMQFPLDFIGVYQGEVVELFEQVAHPTETNPVIATVAFTQELDMVIEVNAGWIETHQISLGDSVVWVQN